MKNRTVLETMYADALDHGESISIYTGASRDEIGSVDVYGRGKNRHVSSLYVAREFRCQGYGTKLMNMVIARHSHVNLHLIAMPSPGQDVPTISSLVRFYRKLGFKLTDDSEVVNQQLVPIGMVRKCQ